jgi:hypothetical protein
VEPGEVLTLTAHVLNHLLEPLSDPETTITATVTTSPTTPYSATMQLELTLEPGIYLQTLTLPEDAPLGRYLVHTTASHPDFSLAADESAFWVTPILTMTLEAAPLSLRPADQVTISAHVFERTAAVSQASAWVRVTTPGGAVTLPLTYDGDAYQLVLTPEHLATELGNRVPYGHWSIAAWAEFAGATAIAEQTINVFGPLYLPVVCRN